MRLNGLKRHFGKFSLAALRSSHISAYRDARLASGLAEATVVKELNSLSHLFDVAAKDWGIGLPANPAKMVRRPQVARGRERRLRPASAIEYRRSCRDIRTTPPHFRWARILDMEARG